MGQIIKPKSNKSAGLALLPKQVRYLDHPDALTTDAHPNFQAWEVELGVIKSATDPRLHFTMYYVRAPHPMEAVRFARRYWYNWERRQMGVLDTEEYPQVPLDQEYNVMAISERDYRHAWSKARRHKHAFYGRSENPLGFTFFNHTTTEKVILTH